MNLKKLKHVHFTGIKGVGMTALALCCQDLDIKVTGSDTDEIFVTDEILKKRNIGWTVGFGAKNLDPKPDLLVATAAHGGLLNPEVVLAKKRKIPVTTYAEFLAEFSKNKELITVCGVGGKTTTSSMITVLLDTAGAKPSFAIGVGSIFPLGVGGRFYSESRNFVCEADEYAISPGVNNKPKFSLLAPKILVVTNIDYDHPDIYSSFEDMKNTFRNYFSIIPKFGVLIACIDNINVAEILKGLNVPIITYGFDKSADWVIKKYAYKNEKTTFDLYDKKNKKVIADITLSVPGKFNIQNATAAYIVGKFLEIDDESLHPGLARFLGTRRRFESVMQSNGVSYYDDYAHHPQEIKATLAAAREWFPKRRIVVIFQPHTYSRTKALFTEFTGAFGDADVVGLMDIYASARESKDESVNSEMLSDKIAKKHKKVTYLGDQRKTLAWIKATVKRGDVVLTMGAGDIFHLYNNLT